MMLTPEEEAEMVERATQKLGGPRETLFWLNNGAQLPIFVSQDGIYEVGFSGFKSDEDTDELVGKVRMAWNLKLP